MQKQLIYQKGDIMSKNKMKKIITMSSLVMTILNTSSTKIEDDIKIIKADNEISIGNVFSKYSNDNNQVNFIHYDLDNISESLKIDAEGELIRGIYSLSFEPNSQSLMYTFDLTNILDNMKLIDVEIASYIYELEEKEVVTYELTYDNDTLEFIDVNTKLSTNTYFNKVLVGYYKTKMGIDVSNLDYEFNYELYRYIFNDVSIENSFKSIDYPKFNIDFSSSDNYYQNQILMEELRVVDKKITNNPTLEEVLKEELLIDNNVVNEELVKTLSKKYR